MNGKLLKVEKNHIEGIIFSVAKIHEVLLAMWGCGALRMEFKESGKCSELLRRKGE